MSSINIKQKNKIHPKILKFFYDEVMPLSADLKQKGEIIPWVSIDVDAITYYKTRQNKSMNKQDFEIGGHSTLETFSADMSAFWGNKDDTKLCKIIPSLTKLANELYLVEDESRELSPYIYVMF